MNQKEEAEVLLNAVLPVAETMLRQHGEFFPYGGYMKPDGSIVHVAATDPDTEQPKSKDSICVLRTSFQELARNNQCKAVALVFDVRVALPNADSKSDAIQVCLDHQEGYSAEVFFPYQIVDGSVLYGETFAQQGKLDVFESAR
jgi:hypothetical protein